MRCIKSIMCLKHYVHGDLMIFESNRCMKLGMMEEGEDGRMFVVFRRVTESASIRHMPIPIEDEHRTHLLHPTHTLTNLLQPTHSLTINPNRNQALLCHLLAVWVHVWIEKGAGCDLVVDGMDDRKGHGGIKHLHPIFYTPVTLKGFI